MTSQYTPFTHYHSDRNADVILICDHATNCVPQAVSGGTLGLSEQDMNRHIAFDIGAAGVTRHLADIMAAPALLSNFSRLVIDPNRGEDDPTLVMRFYDGSMVPANRDIKAKGIQARLDLCYRPYHGEVTKLIAAHKDPVIISIHSFTPRLNGRGFRPWQIGVLYADDDRLARPVLQELRQNTDLDVGDNQPYTGALRGDTMDRHALQAGHLHILIELRSDLIMDEAGQNHWAGILAPVLRRGIFAARTTGDTPNG